MTVVAFDTSTPSTVAAVDCGEGPVSLRLKAPPGRHPAHSSQLLGALSNLLREAGLDWRSVRRIGVGVGPGTFTGLRIAAATAEGLRRSTAAEVVPVDSLDALSVPARRRWPTRPVCAVIDARRGELFASGWAPGGRCVFGPRVLTAADIEATLGSGAAGWLVVGEVPDSFEAALIAAGVERPAAGDPLNLIDGAALCGLTLGGHPEPGPLLPEYLREPDAKRPRS